MKKIGQASMSTLVDPAFGGFLDISHGERFTDGQRRQLLVHALLADQIVLPDTFFHCYGPISHILMRGQAGDQQATADRELLLGLIKHRVIVPATRTGSSSMRKNFREGDGIKPGRFMYLSKDDMEDVLGPVDKVICSTELWDAKYSQGVRLALRRCYATPEGNSMRDKAYQSACEDAHLDPACKDAVDLVKCFRCAAVDQQDESYFRRGYVERAIAKALGISERELYNKISAVGPDTRGPARLAKHLIDDMTAYYHLGHGSKLATCAVMTAELVRHKLDPDAIKMAVRRPPTDQVSGGEGVLIPPPPAPEDACWISYEPEVEYDVLKRLTAEIVKEIRGEGGAWERFRGTVRDLYSNDVGARYEGLQNALAEYCTQLAHVRGVEGPVFSRLRFCVDGSPAVALSGGLHVAPDLIKARAPSLGMAVESVLAFLELHCRPQMDWLVEKTEGVLDGIMDRVSPAIVEFTALLSQLEA